METDALINGYLDLNLLVLAGTLLWLSARKLLSLTRLAHAFQAQLRLMNALTLLLALSPLLMFAFTRLVMAHPPNISDLLVSQFLQGNVSMSAASFESLLGLREDTVRVLTSQQLLWTRLVAAALAMGGLVCAIHVVISVMRLRRALDRAFLWKSIGKTRILVSDETPVAYSTRGLINRYVVLPSTLLTAPQDLKLTLAHELQHFRQRDIECEFLLELLRPALFWNPAFFLWRREVRHLREFACDQALMARPGLDLRAYCECLIRACAEAARERVFFTRRSPAVALVDRRETRRSSTLQQRIIAVTTNAPHGEAGLGWALVSGMMITAVLATAMLIQRPGDWSHDRLMLSTIVNLERMASRTTAPRADGTPSATAILQRSFMPTASP
ncbi:M56 family metallopeptidase [Pseudophaeobacter flagellatus]|uniref:M56 family metallopeptidase n=1 Tax=Pseudophaeobacter flagellatus TaxID=2899119 RepID=UPI001E4576FD|nr:M56 family metallopeptidase [Pseudophaeobacter flagellatus]MCD9149076.1 M56 family metallopeptidase [Pseudophaeobacter flagellatus]